MPAPKRPQRGRRRVRKNIPVGQAHIKTSFNNTIVTLTDKLGNVIAWESAGSAGFKGSRKSTPFAAQVTADSAARKGMEHGLERVEVYAREFGTELAPIGLAMSDHLTVYFGRNGHFFGSYDRYTCWIGAALEDAVGRLVTGEVETLSAG